MRRRRMMRRRSRSFRRMIGRGRRLRRYRVHQGGLTL